MYKIFSIIVVTIFGLSVTSCIGSKTLNCSNSEAKDAIIKKVRVVLGNDIFAEMIHSNRMRGAINYEEVLKMRDKMAANEGDRVIVNIIDETTKRINDLKFEVVNVRTNSTNKDAKSVDCLCNVNVNGEVNNADIQYKLQKTDDGNIMITVR